MMDRFTQWLVAIYFLSHSAGATVPMQVVIDPGHGGKDHGAVHGSQLKESEIALEIARRFQQLAGADSALKTALTRNSDEFLTLEERVEKAKQLKADLFVSIHVNWSKDPKAQGLEVYFQNHLPPDEESMFLAARENQVNGGQAPKLNPTMDQVIAGLSPEVHLILQDLHRNHRLYKSSQLAKKVRQEWQGKMKTKAASIHQAPFFVISNLNIPSILVEVGFISHPIEGPKLATPEYQNTIAQSLYLGIKAYHESLDKRVPSRLE